MNSTLKEVANELGVSIAVAQKIEKRALRKYLDGLTALGLEREAREHIREVDAMRRSA